MLVLVTRPREQAESTASALRARGHEVLIDPVVEIRALPVPALDPRAFAAVAITSANAAPALAGLPAALPVFTVGAATARAVREQGRTVTASASGDGAALAQVIAASLPLGRTVLHLRGRDVHGGLEAELRSAGFGYRGVAVYEAAAAAGMAPEVVAAIRAGKLGAVLFFSPRTARLWSSRVVAAGLMPALRRVQAACLSDAVAQALGGLPFAQVRVAAARTQEAVLRCLEGPG